jgi:hypothetical protein
VGQWPPAESLAAQLIEAFGAAAEQELDPEKKSRLRSIASMLGGAGRDIAVEVAAKLLSTRWGWASPAGRTLRTPPGQPTVVGALLAIATAIERLTEAIHPVPKPVGDQAAAALDPDRAFSASGR